MLSYFRINDPYRVFGLLALQILVFLPLLIDPPPLTLPELKALIVGQKALNGYFLYSNVIDSTAPLTGLLHSFMYFLFGDSVLARHILSLLLIFGLAVFVGIIYIDKKVFPENSFVPSLTFALLFAFTFDALALSGELFGLFFMLLAMNSLFKEIEFREESFEMVLKMGVFTGVASLFAFSFIVFVPGILVMLLIYTRSSARKFLLLLIGFSIPHLLTISIYYINDGAGDLWRHFYLTNLAFTRTPFVGLTDTVPLLLTPLGFLLAALVMVNRESRLTKYQSQVLQAMFFWTVFSIVQVFYAKEFKPQTCIVMVPGIAFFVAHFFLIIRRKHFAEIALWIFIAGLVSGNYYVRYFSLDDESFRGLIVSGYNSGAPKKVVILSNELGGYAGNEMATPFLNWNLAREIFEGPQYYENVIRVYKGFHDDPPDLIVDPDGVMVPFLNKIPELRKGYVRSDEGFRRANAAAISN